MHKANFKISMRYNCPAIQFRDSSLTKDYHAHQWCLMHIKSVLSAMSSKFPAKSPPLGYLAKVMDSPLVQGSNSSYQSSLDNLQSDFQIIGNSSRHSCVRSWIYSNLNQLHHLYCIVFFKNMLCNSDNVIAFITA